MTVPPESRRNDQTTFREAAKQARAFECGGAVRVFGENGFFIVRLDSFRDSERIRRLLKASNSVPIRKHGGKLVGISLLAFGDDRGHSGERYGSSTVTTERVRNDDGILVGSDRTLKHKVENVNHTAPPPAWTAAPRRGPVRAPLAAKR